MKYITHTFVSYDMEDNRIEETVEVPAVNVVCSECRGEGETSSHMGVLSDEDTADEEFMQLYMSGAYDKTCPVCKGKRVVQEMDSGWLEANPTIAQRILDDQIEEARYRRECAMERRFGG